MKLMTNQMSEIINNCHFIDANDNFKYYQKVEIIVYFELNQI